MQPGERTVTVVTTGEAAVTPDRLRLSLGVQVRRDRPGDALEALSSRVTALDQVLDQLGIPTSDRQTSELTLHPEWRERRDRSARPEHVASSGFAVTVADFSTGAELLARAADAVGDTLTVGGLEWLVADADTARQEARRRAVTDATATARQLAADAGRQLGPLRSISEPPADGPQRGVTISRAMAAAGGPALEAGQRQVRVTVEMAWELE